MSAAPPRRARWSAPDHPLQLVSGLTLWSLWFVAVYAIVSVSCAVAPLAVRASPSTAVGAALALVTGFTTAVLLRAAWRGWRASRALASAGAAPVRHFIASTGAVLNVVAALATLFVALPMLDTPVCA